MISEQFCIYARFGSETIFKIPPCSHTHLFKLNSFCSAFPKWSGVGISENEATNKDDDMSSKRETIV